MNKQKKAPVKCKTLTLKSNVAALLLGICISSNLFYTLNQT